MTRTLDIAAHTLENEAGNLTTLADPTPTGTYGANSPLRNARTYTYDGLGRLSGARKNGGATTPYAYDGLGNRTLAGTRTSTYGNQTAPQRVQKVAPGGAVSHDASGAVDGSPASSPAPARTLTRPPHSIIATASTSTSNCGIASADTTR